MLDLELEQMCDNDMNVKYEQNVIDYESIEEMPMDDEFCAENQSEMTLMYRDWSEEQIVHLIDLIKTNPCLWDPEHESYKNKLKRSNAFNCISKEIKVSRDNIERKWVVIQRQFRREYLKAKNKIDNGLDKGYCSTWFGFKHLLFLVKKYGPDENEDMYDQFCMDVDFSNSLRKWTIDDSCKLIELYKQHPVLWNPSCADYRKRIKKVRALKLIAGLLNTTYDEVDRKIRSFNAQYLRERRKDSEVKKIGKGQVFCSTWFGYSLLSFLDQRKKSRKCHESESSVDTNEEDSEVSNTPEILFVNVEAEESNTSTRCGTKKQMVHDQVNKTMQSKSSSKSGNKEQEIKPTKVEEQIQDIYKTIKLFGNNSQQKDKNNPDDFDVFGDLVARKLRNLHTRYAQCTIQHLINNLLYEGELGKYDEPTKNTRQLNFLQASPTSSGTSQ